MIATLIARPGGLEPALAEAVRNACGGSEVVWLSPDEAAEFGIPVRPGTEAEVRRELDARGVDLVIQRADGRRKRLLIADMDSTMIGQECIDELAEVAGVGARVAAITARAMNGELDFEGALRERVGLLAGLDAGVITRLLDERITDAPGARVLVATMRAAGARTVLVSGGFTAFAVPVAERQGFDVARANLLDVADGRLTGRVGEPILGREAKVAALREFSTDLGGAEAALAVGDGANDLGMLGLAGTGVALHAKPAVQAVAPHVVNHGGLTALLFLQGYRRDQFARTQIALRDGPNMKIKLPAPVAAIYRAVEELSAAYPGRKFTPDGHLVGSIGEVIAAEALGLTLYPGSHPGHDAYDDNGDVQIKMTAGASIAMYACCQRLVVLRVVSPTEAEIVYDGPGQPAWDAAGKVQKNGQRTISLYRLRSIAEAARSS